MVFFVFKIYLKDLYFRQSFYKPMIHMIRYKKGNVCLDFIKILLIMGIIIACGAYLIAISSWFLNNLVKHGFFFPEFTPFWASTFPSFKIIFFVLEIGLVVQMFITFSRYTKFEKLVNILLLAGFFGVMAYIYTHAEFY